VKGQDALLTMRRGGKAPSIVFVETTSDRLKTWRDWQAVTPGMATLLIEHDDVPALLDLRCVVGLVVSIAGDCEEFVGRVHDACIEAKASRVISTVTRPNHRGDHEVIRITDTTGAMVWPM